MPTPKVSAAPIFLLFALSVLFAGAFWKVLGEPVPMPSAPLANGAKLDCMSYTPYQASDTPFDPGKIIDPKLIDADIAKLAPMTKCVRVYSAYAHGIAEVAAAASRHGMTVLQGAWISRNPQDNTLELQAATAIAKAHPGTVTAVVAGNEVLLRQEQSEDGLVELIKQAKAATGLPVTYADVWEFWLKHPSVAEAVDFMTIHILPFWEDHPVAAEEAAAHVLEIYRTMQEKFPGKKIIIGEVGWPSMGRMREGARPSPVNQARALHDIIAATRAQGITANIIEAFDQPWKRKLEGTVGGHWGIFNAETREPKFEWGAPLSDHPFWRQQLLTSAGFATVCYGLAAYAAQRRAKRLEAVVPVSDWIKVALTIAVGAALMPYALEKLSAAAFGTGGVARSILLGLVSLGAPLTAVAIAGGITLPRISELIGPKDLRKPCPITRATGWIWLLTIIACVMVALGLTFDPRYLEFGYAPLIAAALGFSFVHAPTTSMAHAVSERMCASVIAACAFFISLNEGVLNWQAQLTSVALLAISVRLWRQGAQTQTS